MKILELAEIIRKKINPNLDLIFKTLPQDDPLNRKPNIDKAINELDWEPQISFNEGLEKTISWFQDNFF